MIGSLIGSIIGLLSAFLPRILDFFQDRRDKTHELRIMEKQLKTQLQLGKLSRNKRTF